VTVGVANSSKQWLLQCQTVLHSAQTGFIFPDQGMARAIPGHTGSSASALNGIGDLKALGPDGMPAIFFKKFWELIGNRVKSEVLQVLNGSVMPEGWNDTNVVLIPKVKEPKCLKELRPISLCNVLYKIISKVIAARLKGILAEIISPNQSAFVPGHLITDNILVAYEMTHF
jgi:hypothetical protein